MPGISGFDVAERLNADPKTKNIRILFLSAIAMNDRGHKNMKGSNVAGFLEKPFDVGYLQKEVEKWVKPAKT